MLKMKKQTGVWIDGSKAIIISIQNKTVTTVEHSSGIENHIYHRDEDDEGAMMGSHHLNYERKFEERKKVETEQFLDKVINELRTSDEIIIMGPSEMKIHLKKKIEQNKILQSKLIGVAATNRLTVNQCLARVKEFYMIPQHIF